ncbi:MAG: PAAR domain-containing protein [Sandaracinaceae bacterium]|nr:PAAR domain-containing protein [Sandaracinaceae bacterium]
MSGSRAPSATETLGSFVPRGNEPAPPSAYRALLQQVRADQEAASRPRTLAERQAEDRQAVVNLGRMEAELFSETFAPFAEAPSSTAAMPGHYIGAVMGVIGLVEQMQYAGIAALTAPLAAITVPLPCVTLMAPALGLPHTHVHPPSTTPPAPPVPLPSLGMVTLPGSINVLVGGLPAARAGDVGLTLTCVSFGSPFEIVLGSSNTLFGGNRVARMGTDMFFHDNPSPLDALGAAMAVVGAVAAVANAVGQAAEGNFTGAALSIAQQQADAAALALKQMRKVDPGGPPDMGAMIMGDPTVLVGGFPMPPAIDLATIAGAVRGLARRVMNRNRARAADAASETSCGTRSCPR